MITAAQLLAHLWGDYILQSDWMAQNKTKSHFAASVHANVYSLPFLLFAPSWKALMVISLSHYLIDRYRLARYVVWAKNWIAPLWQPMLFASDHKRCNAKNFKPDWAGGLWRRRSNPPFHVCSATGYHPDAPVWLATWLLIIADNIIHITINGLALRYL
jgi:hypothetical protein